MAPESARGANTTSAAGDVFAFGVMAIEMLEQRHPFDELPVLAALSGRPHPEHRSTTRAGEALSRALDACLAANPKERPTIDALLALLDE